VLLLSTVLLSASARAQQPGPDVEHREMSARQLFGVGKYSEALEIYARLYAETVHPTYLRNIGRCYQNLGEPDRALSSFREYLRQVRDLAPDQKKLVERYIAEMEGLKRKQESERKTAGVAPPASSVASAPAHARAGEGRSRTPAYLVGGASLAALGVGAVFGVLAISNARAADPDCPMDSCNTNGKPKNDAAVRDARIADVAFGAGLVGAGVAAYLYLTSRPASAPEERTAHLRLRPGIGIGLAGLGLEGRW
jgi:tetratricopeptide (TPR) repeat protein